MRTKKLFAKGGKKTRQELDDKSIFNFG